MNNEKMNEENIKNAKTKLWKWDANKVIDSYKITEKDLPGLGWEYYFGMDDFEYTKKFWLEVIKDYSHGQIYSYTGTLFSVQVLFNPLRFRLLNLADIPMAWIILEQMIYALKDMDIHEEVTVILDDAELVRLHKNFENTCQDPGLMAPMMVDGYYYDNAKSYEEITGIKFAGCGSEEVYRNTISSVEVA